MSASASPDVFDEASPPIVDCDLLMASKENIQPLARGRRATALASVLATPHARRADALSAARARHRLNVQLALETPEDDDDALGAYAAFVRWTVESYPAGQSAESGLLELLEEATRVLKDDRAGKWRADPRYLQLWLLYATHVEKPHVVFRFLLANEIGTAHAQLYEEFAAVLERNGRCTDADEIFLLGIARKAEPLEHLQARHRDFQKRMVLRPAPTAAPSPPVPAPAPSARPVLGDASRPAPRAAPTPQAPAPDVSAVQTTSRAPNARMQVFVDPAGAAAGSSTTPGPWADVGTRVSRVKENVKAVGTLKGATLKQKGVGAGARAAPAFAVFRDEEPGEMLPPKTAKKVPASRAKGAVVPFVDAEPEASVPATPKPAFTIFRDETATESAPFAPAITDSVMKAKRVVSGALGGELEPSTEAEALRRDPLKNYPLEDHPDDA